MADRPTILVPIRVLEGESIPEGIPELLTNAHVVLLGYHVVPDQTAPGQARMQFEDRAIQRLDEFATILEDGGATVEIRLVFTHEAQKTIDRMIAEHGCLAVLVPQATSGFDNILVAIRGTVGIDRLVRVVAELFAGTDAGVTLFHVTDEAETPEDAETLLEGIAARLSEEGMDSDAIDTRIAGDGSPMDAIVEAAVEFDVVVMGESDPTLVTSVFGLPAEQVADRILGPVLVVQREQPAEAEREDTN